MEDGLALKSTPAPPPADDLVIIASLLCISQVVSSFVSKFANFHAAFMKEFK